MQEKDKKTVLPARIYSAVPPTEEQKERFAAFLEKKYGEPVEIVWIRDNSLSGGFRLSVAGHMYDWTREGRLRQLQGALEEAAKGAANADDLITLFRSSVKDWNYAASAEEEGTVLSVGDNIAFIEGLPGAVYGEIVVFENGARGMVQDLREERLGVILFSEEGDIKEGSRVRRTKKTAGVPVGEGYLGRVVNALGVPIDGLGPIRADGYRAIESPAPRITERQAVDTPMNTGLLSIDALFPIGRGQRELIIGDRQTGKTAIAVDSILNQKDSGMICIYCAIGQKTSSVAQLAYTLRKADAMKHTIIVSATAAEAASIQYIAPYAATAIGEYFMRKGQDVLIIYDDLSKHAVAYRALSLLLGRSPGREAYPGDVFYLHSRLLERSAHLSNEQGGGSLTALPIVETQDGDVSAYIPTNIISITDGQIFLETSLFLTGQRPAVNVGLSVSRVGGAAQTKAMKAAAGTLRLDLAQYREMEVFTQFSNDLDEVTRAQLAYGQSLMRLLRQERSRPFSLAEQVVLLTAGTGKAFVNVPLSKVQECRDGLLAYFEENQRTRMRKINESGRMSPEEKAEILEIAKDYIDRNFR